MKNKIYDFNKKILRDIYRMNDESKKIERVLEQDDVNTDILGFFLARKTPQIKNKKTIKKIKQNNLPKLIVNNNNNNLSNKNKIKHEKSNSLNIQNKNVLIKDNNKKYFNNNKNYFSNDIDNFYLKSNNNNLTYKHKKSETFKYLPFSYKRLNKNFEYNNNQLILDDQIENRYLKCDDLLYEDEQNIKYNNYKNFSPKMFFHQNKTKDYYLKKSLMLHKNKIKQFYINPY